MTFRVLIDMSLSPDWVPLLKQEGIKAIHWSSVEPGTAPGETLFAWARENGYVIFTKAEAPRGFRIRNKSAVAEAIDDRVVALLKRLVPHLQRGALVILDEQRKRIRVLPRRQGR